MPSQEETSHDEAKRSAAAYGDRGLRAGETGLFAACGPANPATAIPLRDAAACRRCENDHPKHDTSLGSGNPSIINASRWTPNPVRPPESGSASGSEIHPRQNPEGSAFVYLRAAHAYILISMPTGTSTILGAFQAICALPVEPDDVHPARQGIADEKFRQWYFCVDTALTNVAARSNLRANRVFSQKAVRSSSLSRLLRGQRMMISKRNGANFMSSP